MHLTVIQGGLAIKDGKPRPFAKTDVEAEVARRVRALGYERYKARYAATGMPIPRAVEYLKIQISWVGETLAALHPIPEDFADDRYWPG